MIEYEYQGASAIIAQEIWTANNIRVRNLGVQECKAGIFKQAWDYKSDEGTVVDDGFYFLKLRLSQRDGEVVKISVLHKSTKRPS